MFKHEDERRTLVEVIEDLPIRAVKVLTAKEGCVVGDHYHTKKMEWFYLVSGSGTFEIGKEKGDLKTNELYACPPQVIHTFWLTEGSVLLGLASEPFDPNDEIT